MEGLSANYLMVDGVAWDVVRCSDRGLLETVIYSSEIEGSGIIAGGPFWCAQGSIVYAVTSCMTQPSGISIPALLSQTNTYESQSLIDDTSNLKNHKTWLFSGTKDTVVVQGVMKALEVYFNNYINPSNIVTVFNMPAQHSFVTNNYGSACATLGTPYINNCDFDSAGALLQHIYGKLNGPFNGTISNIVSIDQSQFVPSGYTYSTISMNQQGEYYLPSSGCTSSSPCKLHIAFHGCQQTMADIGYQYVLHTNLNQWAETNNILVLYPQAAHSYIYPSNPNGCWDWWGYVSSYYSTNKGPQMVTIHNMANYLKTKYSIQ